ncbi:hypothetical protein ZWY2020_030842 [Hordeum vulgare]|nr:hypothetical protein ZWY2020_030842 [Hordeum vulgare]
MAGRGGLRSAPPIRSADPRRHARGSSSAGASSSRCRRSPDPPTATSICWFEDFLVLSPPRPLTRAYLGARQRWWGMWLAAMEYDRWQVSYHDAAVRLNFPFGMAPVHLVPPEPRVVSSTMAQQGREVRERLEADAAAEAYMQELHRQYPKLVEAERMIFADAGDEVIIISSSDEVEGDKDDSEVGGEDEKINIDEWRSVFPDDKDDGTGPDPSRGTPYVTRKDWLNLTFERKKFSQDLSMFMFECMLLLV